MRTALVADLAAIESHEIVTTTDRRFRRGVPPGVEEVFIDSGDQKHFGSLVDTVDAVWLVAPESNRCLERLAARVERRGKRVLGSSAAAIGRASDKALHARRLARVGVRHPETVLLKSPQEAPNAAIRLGYPVVVKPRRGAGGRGVHLARHARDLKRALPALRRVQDHNAAFLSGAKPEREFVMQRYVSGIPASVSLLANGREAIALAVNAQRITTSRGVSYHGGRTPLEHPLAAAAAEAALRTCAAFPGLRGYVGVDLVMSDRGPVVIEVNPRLTTAYLGVRAVLDENVAQLALDACRGYLPPQPVTRRRVRFTSSGVVAAA